MKIIITAFSIATLLCVSSAFAVEQTTNVKSSKQIEDKLSTISAFQNVESSPLTAGEMKTAGAWVIVFKNFCMAGGSDKGWCSKNKSRYK